MKGSELKGEGGNPNDYTSNNICDTTYTLRYLEELMRAPMIFFPFSINWR